MSENEKAARKKTISHAIMMIILIAVFILFIFPFLLVVINVFKSNGDITSDPLRLIGEHGFTTANFPEAMKSMDFLVVFRNSLIVTTTSTILTLLVSSMAAFVIVRNKWKACALLFAGMIASMVIPFQVLMIPLVSLYGGIFGVLNSRITLILMHTGFSVSMATFMFHGAIHTNIPLELEEAALIDGCSSTKLFFNIIMPMLTPIQVTLLVFVAMGVWNDYLLSSLFLNTQEMRTLPMMIRVFCAQYSNDYAPMMAGLVMSILPMLAFYLAGQKQILEGVVQGSVKG